jgi:hypothetical protein
VECLTVCCATVTVLERDPAQRMRERMTGDRRVIGTDNDDPLLCSVGHCVVTRCSLPLGVYSLPNAFVRPSWIKARIWMKRSPRFLEIGTAGLDFRVASTNGFRISTEQPSRQR